MEPVARWLERLGLGQYTAAFAEADIDREVLRAPRWRSEKARDDARPTPPTVSPYCGLARRLEE
jgi:hypothetical protein